MNLTTIWKNWTDLAVFFVGGDRPLCFPTEYFLIGLYYNLFSKRKNKRIIASAITQHQRERLIRATCSLTFAEKKRSNAYCCLAFYKVFSKKIYTTRGICSHRAKLKIAPNKIERNISRESVSKMDKFCNRNWTGCIFLICRTRWPGI